MKMLIVIILSVILLNVIMLYVFSYVSYYENAKCNDADCHYSEWNFA